MILPHLRVMFAILEGEKAVKLVDRLAFSTANFNVEKNWVAGDGK